MRIGSYFVPVSIGNFTSSFKRLLLTICSIFLVIATLILFRFLSHQPPHISKKLLLLKENAYFTSQQQTCRQICQSVPEVSTEKEAQLLLVGDITVNPNYEQSDVFVARNDSPGIMGGAWAFRKQYSNSVSECERSYGDGVAVVIACRERWSQINVMLLYLIPLLQKQRLCYRIFIIEQHPVGEFNKAMLLNIGFMEAAERFRFRCVVFQDADLAPINDANPYGCDSLTETAVVHLGVGLDNRGFKLRYKSLVGGALKFSVRNFVHVNGYSNMYWGWGQEDDDMEVRIRARGLHYVHMANGVARYHAIPHSPSPKNRVKEHLWLLRNARTRASFDGLNSLNYTVFSVNETMLYTRIVADFPTKD